MCSPCSEFYVKTFNLNLPFSWVKNVIFKVVIFQWCAEHSVWICIIRSSAPSMSFSFSTLLYSRLGGDKAPDDWQAGLNITYRLGPGFIDPYKDW